MPSLTIQSLDLPYSAALFTERASSVTLSNQTAQPMGRTVKN
jgi:hypothetical protein